MAPTFPTRSGLEGRQVAAGRYENFEGVLSVCGRNLIYTRRIELLRSCLVGGHRCFPLRGESEWSGRLGGGVSDYDARCVAGLRGVSTVRAASGGGSSVGILFL